MVGDEEVGAGVDGLLHDGERGVDGEVDEADRLLEVPRDEPDLVPVHGGAGRVDGLQCGDHLAEGEWLVGRLEGHVADDATPAYRGGMETPAPEHWRPDGVSDETVEALGKLSEALEVVENARGYLYAFHRLTGMGDLALGDAVDLFRKAGHDKIADRIDAELVGRNVIEGRWTFQIVEDYDDGYYALFKQLEAGARDELVSGRRHLFEAEMKEDRRTHGARHHEAAPEPSA
jgi:hypothetical protein